MTPPPLARLRKTATALLVASSLFLVAACDSAEERAEKYYQSGMELLEKGDVDRALVEFRNVFKLNGQHKEARRAYAKAERDRGRLREAYSQYLRLVEQYPDDLDGQRSLAEIAIQSGDFDTADTAINEAVRIAPEDKEVAAIRTAVDYSLAKRKGDTAGTAAALERAVAARKELPDNAFLAGVIIDDALVKRDFDTAIREIDAAIKVTPEDRALYALRLSTLSAKGDNAGVEAGLAQMVDRFPDDATIPETLVRWYVSQKQFDKAETFLRGQTVKAPDASEPVMYLVRFLAEQKGPEAAIAELDAQIASGKSAPMFRATRAGLLFDLGKQDDAISEMEQVLQNADDTSEETQNIKIGLARMLMTVGNAVGGQALVEEVLKANPSNIDALKLKATWLIMSDNTADAVGILRQALDDHPRDTEAMTLMAQAHERDGNRQLMREMLALAVESSGNAPAETLRYVQALASEGEYLAAESALIDSLRLSPGNPDLLVPLGQIYIQIKDWPRAEAVAADLEKISDPRLAEATTNLRAAIYAGQQSTEQAIGYLQGLVNDGTGGLTTKIAIIRTHLSNGENAEALAYAKKLVEEAPNDPSLRFILSSVQSVEGDFASAEQGFRSLVAEDATRSQVWMALYRVVAQDPSRLDEAGKVLDDALAANPDIGELKWAKAGYLERKGDIDGAIKVYEDLYAENSNNMIVANNLASLISSYRDDEASLNRAEVIARRLRDSEIPAYQDTYGWIAYRLGRFDEAERNLVKAAESLADDPMVQYHLGMVYVATGKLPQATEQFQKVLGMVPEGDSRPFVASTREQLAKLGSGGSQVNN